MRIDNEHDEKIERALRVVGQALPREGIEARVLQGIQLRRHEAGRKRSTSPRGAAFGLVASAGVLMAAGMFVAPWHHRNTQVPAVREVEVRRAASARDGAVTHEVAASGRVVRAARWRVRGEHRALQVERVSFPAPTAPLTKEERLLAAVAASPHPQAVEALNPVRRAESVLETELVFQSFVKGRNTGGYE